MTKAKDEFNGRIELICGAMFSGKTERLIHLLKEVEREGHPIALFKPQLDTRYATDAIVSHSGYRMPAKAIAIAEDALDLIVEEAVVAFDEAQFFGPELLEVCRSLAQQGHRVIAAGLERDYLNRPFGPMSSLLVEAEHVTKLQALCAHCGAPASFTFRKGHSNEQVMLGASVEYAALCRSCYTENMR